MTPAPHDDPLDLAGNTPPGAGCSPGKGCETPSATTPPETPAGAPADRARRRLDRQFAALGRIAPRLRAGLDRLRSSGGTAVRVPAGLALVAGGVLSVLPGLGLWMLPVGLMLLAIDVPALRPGVSAAVIRLRRRWAVWRRGRS
jgi:hypothetical protein